MKKIDRETIQRILDTAEIVDVVSDFVTLKRKGSSYIGLCPFHNERTPSFSVSKSKNICKCFSCGKGGSPLNFIMELEQLSYNEALRYLAKKYNIEIKEHEMTTQEQELESERAGMFAANEFALSHFKSNLYDTEDGRNIGLSYFYDRSLSDASIKKFQLGYALEKSTTLYDAAIRKGFSEKYLIETGLCIRTDQGRIYDRFKGRVIFPVFSVSGKVVAFGGRTLKKDVAKYVNSPESMIYHKSNQLYGMYQAKPAIVKHDKCILVEGYMDVISMHQSGVENVVASSGTSLTDGQIRMIHRFTSNVTVIYDGDAAGIKASLRGIDMLLAEGLSIKVLLLPDGDDPDSFARKHSSSELEAYIKENEVDFIQFKTNILLQGVENDPIARSKVINDIVRSIAVIPNPVDRNIYIKECSRSLDIDERVVNLEVTKQAKSIIENNQLKAKQQEARESLKKESETPSEPTEPAATAYQGPIYVERRSKGNETFLRPYEKEILKYAIRYGMIEICEDVDDNGNSVPMNVLEYIISQLEFNDLKLENKDILTTFNEAIAISRQSWAEDLARNDEKLLSERADYIARGEESIRVNVSDMSEIERAEKALIETADERYNSARRQFAMLYLSKALSSHPDETIRNLTLELVSDKHVLSKVYTKYAHITNDEERIDELVQRALYHYEDAILECRIRSLTEEIKEAYTISQDEAKTVELMRKLSELQQLRGEFAKYLGERIINPRK